MPVGVNPQTLVFLETLWGQEEYIVYVAFARRDADKKVTHWDQRFYTWPTEKDRLLAEIDRRKPHDDVYFCPALFSKADSHKENVAGAWSAWLDFDGEPPSDLLGVPEPTIKVSSSGDGHEHWYWRLAEFTDVETVERINKGLAYLFSADKSGWDANQVLRPPNTFNHKRSRTVDLISYSNTALPVGLFDQLPTPAPTVNIEVYSEDDLPDVNAVVFRHAFPENVARLFTSQVEGPSAGQDGKRSAALMSLGYSFAEMNLTDKEMMTLLTNAAERWGKFAGRSDKQKRIAEIISIARQKYPYKIGSSSQKIQLMGFKTLLASEVHLSWVWEGWLQEGGSMLLTGPPAVGKTQLTLDVAGHFAIGKSIFGQAVTAPRKIGFLSLEMNLVELKEFLLLLQAAFTPEEREILEENFLILPLGEPLYLNRTDTKEAVEEMIGDYKLDGIILDSLSSAAEGDIGAFSVAQDLMDWNDRMRNRFNCFSWIIHHNRKATGENKKPNKLSDVYGPYLFTSRPTSVFCMWPTEVSNAVEVIPLKVRLAKPPANFYVRRGPNLHFEKVSNVAIQTAPATTTVSRSLTVVNEERTSEGGVGF